MTLSTHITRLAKATALGVAIAALVLPAAQAGDIVVDDYFRDGTTLPSSPVVADYFRDGAALTATDRPLIDDWFRDGATVDALGEVVVDDWFRDAISVSGDRQPLSADERALAASMVETSAIAAPTPTALRTNVVGDDWFRDSQRVTDSQATARGFAWSDFGIGAGSMFGLLALVTGLSAGVAGSRKAGRTLSRA